MRHARHQRRPGFTLLEVTLALAIAMLLLAAMYTSFTVFFNMTQAGRQVVTDAAEIRAVLNKLSDDISSELAPLDTRAVLLPQSFTQGSAASSSSSATSSSSSSSAATTSSTTASSSSTTPASGTSSSSSSSSSSSTQSTADGTYAYFNMGVVGNNQQLTLFVGKVPDYKLAMKSANSSTQALSDLRRVCYWVAEGGGLARQEVKIATSADALGNMPFGGADEKSLIFSDKVVSVTFQYYDGATWQDNWDGSQFGSDGKTPLGPPMAISIDMDVKSGPNGDGAAKTVTYHHVVFLAASNGLGQQNGATSSSPSSSSGSSSSGQ